MTESMLSKRRRELKKRHYEAALDKTKRAVILLNSLGAKAVYVFGSMLNPERFDEMSDVDIYVEGLQTDKRKGLFSQLEEIFGEVSLDILFDDDAIRPHIIEKIRKEGKLWKP